MFNHFTRTVSRSLWSAIALLTLAACSDDDFSSPPPAPTLGEVYAVLDAQPKGTTIAVNGTQQLTVTARTVNGATLPITGTPTYTSADLNRVTISPTGLITGKAATGIRPVRVVVKVSEQGLTHTDTVYVAVTATASPVTSISIHPVAPDSARLAIYSSKVVNVIARNGTTVVPGVYAYVTPKDRSTHPSLIDVMFRGLQPLGLGKQWLYARATVYGVALTDSVEYEFIDAVNLNVYIMRNGLTGVQVAEGPGEPTFYGSPGAVVRFTNGLDGGTMTGIQFEDPSTAEGEFPGADAGNIAPLGTQEIAARRFVAKGTYVWRTTTTPVLTGRIVIR